MLDEYSNVSEDNLGTFKSAKAKLTLKECDQAHFHKGRAVPHELRPKVEEQLRRLQKEGILTKVEWVWILIVPVSKKDRSVRICGDYKVTVNPELQDEHYPSLRIEDIFAKLAGGKRFSKIDLPQAYHQLDMEEESKKYLIINTHMGVFHLHPLSGSVRLIKCWKEHLVQVVSLITGDDYWKGWWRTPVTFTRSPTMATASSDHCLRANKAKCDFFKEKITNCGHDIDCDGLRKSIEKVEAVLKAPRPNDVAEVRSFLRLINYYHRFLPYLSRVVYDSTLGKESQMGMGKTMRWSIPQSQRNDHFRLSFNPLWSKPTSTACLWCSVVRCYGIDWPPFQGLS